LSGNAAKHSTFADNGVKRGTPLVDFGIVALKTDDDSLTHVRPPIRLPVSHFSASVVNAPDFTTKLFRAIKLARYPLPESHVETGFLL